MPKKRYIALFVIMALVLSAVILSVSLSALADTWKGDIKNEKLTAEDAEEVALADAGYTRDEVIFKPTEYDYEKGKAVWEVEFYHENIEYDFEIDANTGEILKKHQEIENKPTKPTPEPTPTPSPEPTAPAGLSEEKALEIALADAGLTAEVISHLKIEKDRDDGVLVYEIEFDHGYTEYDYEIRVSDGKILERDIDLD